MRLSSRSTAFKYSNPPKVEYPLGSSQSDDSHDADSLDESSDAETSHYQPSRNLHAAPPLSPVRGRLGDVYGKEPHENLIENVVGFYFNIIAIISDII